jgi:predicted N-formylglutamate amidohydrolase
MAAAATDRMTADGTAEIVNPSGRGAFVIVCEHASRFIPDEFGGLGLEEPALTSHIAWDPGALAVADEMSARLDSPLVVQRVSRLLYDCNRPPEREDAVPAVSEVYSIPGNARLSAAERQARVDRFYTPFRKTLVACIEERVTAGQPPVLVTVHSFTPVYKGVRRDTELGILHDADTRLADALIEIAASRDLTIRRNDPYGPADGVTHTLVEHGLSRGLLNVMLEIRNDLIVGSAAQTEMAAWLARSVAQAVLVAEGIPGGREIA